MDSRAACHPPASERGATRRLRCGISIQIGAAVASIVGLSIFWLLAAEAWNPLKAEADEQVTNATAQQAIDWTGIAFDNFLAIALAIIVVGTIAASVYQRQGGF